MKSKFVDVIELKPTVVGKNIVLEITERELEVILIALGDITINRFNETCNIHKFDIPQTSVKEDVIWKTYESVQKITKDFKGF